MQTDDLLASLVNATITQGLGRADLETLLQYATVETVPQGWMVLAEGQRGEALYVVLKGQLKVMLLVLDHRDHPNRVRDIYLHPLSPGDCFGEYSLIDSEPVSASVIARRVLHRRGITFSQRAYHLSVCFQPWDHNISTDFTPLKIKYLVSFSEELVLRFSKLIGGKRSPQKSLKNPAFY